jgi:hypothetical protein
MVADERSLALPVVLSLLKRMSLSQSRSPLAIANSVDPQHTSFLGDPGAKFLGGKRKLTKFREHLSQSR